MNARTACWALLGALAIPFQALGYTGPGAGLTAIGIVVAFIASVFLLFVGFIWYPIKRLVWRPIAGFIASKRAAKAAADADGG